MRAAVIEGFGQEPTVKEMEVRSPGAGEILIKLEAASVNPVDLQIAAGAFQGRAEHRFPLILGFDGAGRVEAVGEGVTTLSAGDRVVGQLWSDPIGQGAFAEYATIEAAPRAGAIVALPEDVDVEHAAALPTAGVTALGAVEAISASAGHTVAILGATGGVGSFATELLTARGARVIVTCRQGGEERMRRLGAAETIDYSARPVGDALPDGIDAVLDCVGDAALLAQVAARVRDGGRVVSIAFGASPELQADTRVVASNYMNQDKPGLLSRMVDQLAAGSVSVDVQRRHALSEVPAALAALRGGGSQGKTIINI